MPSNSNGARRNLKLLGLD